jgi:hypothetical protein
MAARQATAATQRPPAAAGKFYPADAAALERTVHRLLDHAADPRLAEVRGLIVPHAGYAYSGQVAAAGFKTFAHLPPVGYTVYLMGPAHYAPAEGVALSSAASFATPLGMVPVAARRVGRWLDKGAPYRLADAAHAPEHALEVQLPFLQVVLGRLQIVPMLFGLHCEPEQISRDLAVCAPNEDCLVVASSDLSHFHPYAEAATLDRAFLAAVVAGDFTAAAKGEACGLLSILCLMHLAQARGWTAHLLGYANSGDSGGPRHSVVGYGAVAFTAGGAAAVYD